MTTPGGAAPDGSFVVGSAFGSDLTESSIRAIATGGAKVSFTNVQNTHNSQVKDPLQNTHLIATSAQGTADQAVNTAQAAANDAAAAVETADVAYESASFWWNEFVVASAGVVLGVNELLLGPIVIVPGGLTAVITDIHLAFISQPAGIVVETKLWNPTGTASSVIHTATLGANVTRIEYSALNISVLDKQRVYANVTSITGTDAPVVLQVTVAGAILF